MVLPEHGRYNRQTQNAQPPFRLDRARRTLTTDEETSVALSRLEYVFLDLLFENAGRVVGFDLIAESLWGEHRPSASAVKIRLKSLVRRLRDKTGDGIERIDVVIPVRGRGYMVEGDAVGTNAQGDDV